MLTVEQIAFFQEHGYLVLENFIDSEIIDGWREQIWKHFDSSLETRRRHGPTTMWCKTSVFRHSSDSCL